MVALFISDLHLDENRPEITALLLDFLTREAAAAERLFILGDLFESWIGDDHVTELSRTVAAALRRLADRGVAVGFLAGNRDFLLGEDYAAAAGMTVLEDPHPISLAGRSALLTHGDGLCTDDDDYQAFRAEVRHPDWQREFLALPIPERLAFARRARDASRFHTSGAPTAIMDVNPKAVDELMRRHRVELLIHGHTHRPAIHELKNGRRRVVLGDWYRGGSVLRIDGEQLELATLPGVRS